MADEYTMSQSDRAIVRDLATRVAEIAADPHQEQTAELWRKLNRLERTRPLILLYDATQHETGQRVKCECEGELARQIEFNLKNRIWHWENMRDDSVWEARFACNITVDRPDYGIACDHTSPDYDFGASQFNSVLADDEDPARIPMPKVTVNWDETETRYEFLNGLLGDILSVEKTGVNGYWFATMDSFIAWRGIEQTMVDMIDRPEWVHAWMKRMCDFHLSLLDQYQELGALSLNNRSEGIGSGGVGFTDQLPGDGFDPAHVRTVDQWGHATTQIFSEVSPAMHEEFALKYEKQFLDRFGLCNYGCCEPLHMKVDVIMKHLPHCRKMSMSPRADVARGAEALGKQAVFSWKPNPTMLGVANWDTDVVKKEVRDAFEKTRDCVVEVVMKDLHTVRGEVKRMADWVYAVKEVAEDFA